MRMSTSEFIKRSMTAEPVETRWEEAVCGFGVYPDCLRGEYLGIPLRVRADSKSPIQLCAKANLQIMLERRV